VGERRGFAAGCGGRSVGISQTIFSCGGARIVGRGHGVAGGGRPR
jgi:hypothetical protein